MLSGVTIFVAFRHLMERVAMFIRVQSEERHWRVLHPDQAESIAFHDGSAAFDFADALAREFHARTGEPCGVRVEVSDAFVDTVSYG